MSNREHARQVRREKSNKRAKQRREEASSRKAREDASLLTGSVPEEVFPLSNQLFWLAHGVNCLLSDYRRGVWTPLFEGIYEGHLPNSREEIQLTVLQRFAGQKEWAPEAKAALAWTVSSPKLLHVYWHEAMRRMQRAHPDLEPHEVEPLIRRPADGCVWDLFHYLMRNLLQRKAV